MKPFTGTESSPAISRREALTAVAKVAGVVASSFVAGKFGMTVFAAENQPDEAKRNAYRAWLQSLPAAPVPELTKHGLVATELQRWSVMEGNQGVAVDGEHFYGIGNHALVKHRKD
ncbi:MAG: hypothetical protein Q8L06_17820, partial [Pseudohongiella sp.]|nr:hypothetical protein [Pseudohongiella sp.]